MKFNKVLRYIALTCLFLVPFIPLIVANNMFFPFITGKNFAFRILVEIMLGSWLILALRDKEYLPKKSWVLWGFGTLMVILALADIGSANPHKSFWSNFERMEGYVTFIHLFAYFVVTAAMLRTKKLWAEFIKVELVASLLVGFVAFMQLIYTNVAAINAYVGTHWASLIPWVEIHQGSNRPDASLGNSAYLAVYMLFNVFIFLFLLVKYIKEKQEKEGSHAFRAWMPWLLAAGALFETFVLYITATRGTILGLGVGLVLVCILFAIKEPNKLLKRTSIGILIAIVVIIIAFVAGKNSNFVQNSPTLSRFSTLATTNIGQILSTDGLSRVEIWQMAAQGIAERPILGWGQESFNYIFYKYYNPDMYAQEPWFDRAHDIILDWLVDAGVLGLLAYLSLFAAAIWYLIKDKGGMLSFAERTIIGGALLAYFIHNLFVFDNITSYIMFFTLLAYLHHVYGGKIKEATAAKLTTLSANAYAVTASIIVVVVLFGLYFFNVKGIEASTTLTQALSQQPGGVAQNITLYQDALNLNSFGEPEVREYVAQFAMQAASVTTLDQTTKNQIYQMAVTSMLQQVQDTPLDVRYYYFLEHIYLSFNDVTDALPVVQKALTLSPKKQLLLFDLGNIYLNQGQDALGVATFKQAYDEAPAYNDALVYYAMSLIISGDQKDADSLLIPVYGTDLVQDSRIILAYTTIKDYAKVIAIYKLEIAADPTNVQDYVSLAGTYYQAGENSLAVAELKALEKIDLADTAQIEQYIDQIEGITATSTAATAQ